MNMDYGDERLPVRFWNKVYPEPNTGCWLWGGSTSNGYGQIVGNVPRLRVLAHRWAYATATGDWAPQGADTDHLCRQRACVNPAHLEVVTHQVNVLRGDRAKPSEVCKREHLMQGDNVYLSWSTNRLGERVRRRHCHTCMQDRGRSWARANQSAYRATKRLAELRGGAR